MDFTQPVTEFVSFNLSRLLRESRTEPHGEQVTETEEGEIRRALREAGYDDATIEDAIASTREQSDTDPA